MSMLRRLWNDDQGAIISVEWILIVAILLFGLIPGLVALRNSINASMATIGNILLQIVPSFTFSGFGLGAGGGGTNNIAQVGGFAFSPNASQYITSYAVAPVVITNGTYFVDPTP